MKIPQRPPTASISGLLSDPSRLTRAIQAVQGPTVDARYYHWDELRHRKPPEGFSVEEWWAGLKLMRLPQRRITPLEDVQSRPFWFTLVDPIPEKLHRIDTGTGAMFPAEERQPVNDHERDRYIVRSLMEEAITSSQIEGAATTRVVAKQMLRSGRLPRDTSERMILNNYLAMKQILARERQAELTPEFVMHLHRTLTQDTLEDPTAVGRLRRPEERVVVEDAYGQVLHEPPQAQLLESRLKQMCRFANGQSPSFFVHPVLRAIILHFWLAYDHPFVDGNGRCARALFYWSMLRNGLWLMEFISISDVIKRSQTQYGRAFLHTETDENDLTYFILYHLKIIEQAVDELHVYIAKKQQQTHAISRLIRDSVNLNHRQRALLSHALRHPDAEYTIESHQTSHQIVYQTARTDLHDLAGRGLLVDKKVGRTYVFTPPPDLQQRLSQT
jgi:Fic family protein